MITPIRCVINLGQELFDSLKFDKHKYKTGLILNSSKLLLSQVNMLLDKSLMENNCLTPHLEQNRIFEIVRDIVEILKGQAQLRDIELEFIADGVDTLLLLDNERIK